MYHQERKVAAAAAAAAASDDEQQLSGSEDIVVDAALIADKLGKGGSVLINLTGKQYL